ncbi:2-oxoglutarate and oxygenase superfamily protein [Perilla frutescens var. frutescens]|nr:2-oxoglutarate and oxygenase superfamily protein [Perilla frutescens var. frutescens]
MRNKGKIRSEGYIPQSAVSPLYQSFGIDDPRSPQKLHTFVNRLWSQGNPTFSKNIVSFSEELSEVDKLIRRMVVESLGLEKYMKEHLDSTYYVARVQKYDAPRSREAELGARSHSDKNIITILYQLNQVPGFEFFTKDGEWILVQPSLNSYIVMAGESLSAWTNGRLHPPQHRVMMAGEEDRYTIALFSNPKAGYMIKAPEEMVDEEHPLLYMPFDYNHYLQFYFSQAGQTSPDALKEFCGA